MRCPKCNDKKFGDVVVIEQKPGTFNGLKPGHYEIIVCQACKYKFAAIESGYVHSFRIKGATADWINIDKADIGLEIITKMSEMTEEQLREYLFRGTNWSEKDEQQGKNRTAGTTSESDSAED